jgi:hypothetical protein
MNRLKRFNGACVRRNGADLPKRVDRITCFKELDVARQLTQQQPKTASKQCVIVDEQKLQEAAPWAVLVREKAGEKAGCGLLKRYLFHSFAQLAIWASHLPEWPIQTTHFVHTPTLSSRPA